MGNLLSLENFVPFFWDWLTHDSPLGGAFQGTESWGDMWNRLKQEQQERWEDLPNNWDLQNGNVFAQAIGDIVDVYKASYGFFLKFWKGNGPIYTPENMEQADWRPSYQQGTPNNYFNPNMGFWNQANEPAETDALQQKLDRMEKNLDPMTVKMEPEPGAAGSLAEQVGTVNVPAMLVYNGFSFGWGQGGGGTGGAGNNSLAQHANGIWSVPSDNYLALLHRGERVVPARQVNSRNFSSNLYVENMNMNNGMDAQGLADRIAASQRRTMSGYGSC